jgi:hypothetical protein
VLKGELAEPVLEEVEPTNDLGRYSPLVLWQWENDWWLVFDALQIRISSPPLAAARKYIDGHRSFELATQAALHRRGVGGGVEKERSLTRSSFQSSLHRDKPGWWRERVKRRFDSAAFGRDFSLPLCEGRMLYYSAQACGNSSIIFRYSQEPGRDQASR